MSFFSIKTSYSCLSFSSHGLSGHSKRLSCGATYAVIAGIWAASVLFAACPLLGWGRYVYEGMLVRKAFLVFCWIFFVSRKLGAIKTITYFVQRPAASTT